MSHFKMDDDGLYYHPRLEEEKKKRQAYSESRAENRRKKQEKTSQKYMKNISLTRVEDMGNINRNRNISNNSKFSIPKVEDIELYCKERRNTVDAAAFFDFYQSKGWKVGTAPMKDWKAAVRTWEKRTPSRQGNFNPEEELEKALRRSMG